MILPTRWRDVRAPARVIDPAGKVWHVLTPYIAGLALVSIRDETGSTRVLPVDLDAFIPVLYESEDVAVANLAACFDLEFLRG